MWLIFGFVMTNSYRSLLRANMIKVDYKQAIDTIDDVLQSKIKVTTCGDCNMPEKLKTDPRQKVKELTKQFEFFQSAEHGKVPENVEKGYFYNQWWIEQLNGLIHVSGFQDLNILLLDQKAIYCQEENMANCMLARSCYGFQSKPFFFQKRAL